LDGTDALMLSEETAAGEYPLEAVKIMAQVSEETEKLLEPRQRFPGLPQTVPEAISLGAISLARDLQVKAFLIPTTSGNTARLIARYRPLQPIIAVSPDPLTVKMLCLAWGVFPSTTRGFKSTDEMVRVLQQKAVESGLVKRGDLVVITAGLPLHQSGTTNMITAKVIE
jgi:pyruvate kinase